MSAACPPGPPPTADFCDADKDMVPAGPEARLLPAITRLGHGHGHSSNLFDSDRRNVWACYPGGVDASTCSNRAPGGVFTGGNNSRFAGCGSCTCCQAHAEPDGVSFHSQVAHVVHQVYVTHSCPQKFLPLHTVSEIARFSSTPPEWLRVLTLSQGGPGHASVAQASLLTACSNLPVDIKAGGRGYIMGAYVGGLDVRKSSGLASIPEAASIQARGGVGALCAAIRSCSQEFLLGASGVQFEMRAPLGLRFTPTSLVYSGAKALVSPAVEQVWTGAGSLAGRYFNASLPSHLVITGRFELSTSLPGGTVAISLADQGVVGIDLDAAGTGMRRDAANFAYLVSARTMPRLRVFNDLTIDQGIDAPGTDAKSTLLVKVTSSNDFEVMARAAAGSSMQAILEAVNRGPMKVGTRVLSVVAPDMLAAAELNVWVSSLSWALRITSAHARTAALTANAQAVLAMTGLNNTGAAFPLDLVVRGDSHGGLQLVLDPDGEQLALSLCASSNHTQCAANEACWGFLCRSKQARQAACVLDPHCKSGRCVESKGELSCGGCAGDVDCPVGSFCALDMGGAGAASDAAAVAADRYSCTPGMPLGSACDRDAACQSGRCLSDNHSAAHPVCGDCKGDADCSGGSFCEVDAARTDRFQCKPRVAPGVTNCDGACRRLAASTGGGQCSSDADCASSKFCGSRPPAPRMCQPTLALSKPCSRNRACSSGICRGRVCSACSDDSQCPRAQYCSNMGPPTGSRCRPRSPAGAPCASGSQCQSRSCIGTGSGSTTMRCAACTEDSSCPGDQFCQLDATSGGRYQCQGKLALGALCDRSRSCQSGRCRGPPGATRCVMCGRDDDCPAARFCRLEARSKSHNQCVDRLPLGTPCAGRGRVCGSGRCIGVSAGSPRACGDCADDSECADSKFCQLQPGSRRHNQCQAKADLGAPCDRDRACWSGHCRGGPFGTSVCGECDSDQDCPEANFCAKEDPFHGSRCRPWSPLGAQCVFDSECQNRKCLRTGPGGTKRCADCAGDEDCPAAKYCDLDLGSVTIYQCRAASAGGVACDSGRTCEKGQCIGLEGSKTCA